MLSFFKTSQMSSLLNNHEQRDHTRFVKTKHKTCFETKTHLTSFQNKIYHMFSKTDILHV